MPDTAAAEATEPYRYEEHARGIWGDDATYCADCKGWHHWRYHDAPWQPIPDGYERGTLPDSAVIPDAYLHGTMLIFVHHCSFTEGIRKTELPQGTAYRQWRVAQTPEGELTVHPSIHCKACGLHGYFTAGSWSDA